jgi:DNA-binding transcriptional regulator YiaG
MAKKKPPLVNPWPERLKALRAKLGNLTREEAAAMIRISPRAWGKWEQGLQTPSPSHQLLIELLEQGKF